MNDYVNPSIPFRAQIPGGVHPGKQIKVRGFVPSISKRFTVDLICVPMGDVALRVCPMFAKICIIRNSVHNMQMGFEESFGAMPIQAGEHFELLILCEPQNFKIFFNGRHFVDFNHRLPYNAIQKLAIDGDVTLSFVNFSESNPGSRNIGLVVPPPSTNYGPPSGQGVPCYPTSGVPMAGSPYPMNPPNYSGGPYPTHPPNYTGGPYPTNPPNYSGGSYPTNPPNYAGGPYPTNHGAHPGVPYPQNNPGYPTQPGFGNQNTLYPQVPVSNQGGHPVNGGYPHSPTSQHRSSSPSFQKSHKSGGFLDKAGMAVAGVLGTTAVLGGKKALKKQMKAHKKALKYGLPLAGAGVGAYALHKGFHGFRRSSSSSSSSSD